jgi:hypothetical protein
MVWTLIEPGMAITAACLVTMRPLLRCLNLRGFESTPAAQQTPLTLRNDVSSGGHWSTISSRGGEEREHKRSLSLTAMERLKTRNMGLGKGVEEGWEEEVAVGMVMGSEVFSAEGITRTVHIHVEHDRASQVRPG